jgi:hypothetical protein
MSKSLSRPPRHVATALIRQGTTPDQPTAQVSHGVLTERARNPLRMPLSVLLHLRQPVVPTKYPPRPSRRSARNVPQYRARCVGRVGHTRAPERWLNCLFFGTNVDDRARDGTNLTEKVSLTNISCMTAQDVQRGRLPSASAAHVRVLCCLHSARRDKQVRVGRTMSSGDRPMSTSVKSAVITYPACPHAQFSP